MHWLSEPCEMIPFSAIQSSSRADHSQEPFVRFTKNFRLRRLACEINPGVRCRELKSIASGLWNL